MRPLRGRAYRDIVRVICLYRYIVYTLLPNRQEFVVEFIEKREGRSGFCGSVQSFIYGARKTTVRS